MFQNLVWGTIMTYIGGFYLRINTWGRKLARELNMGMLSQEFYSFFYFIKVTSEN